MRKFREIIYKNTNFDEFLVIYLNRFPNNLVVSLLNYEGSQSLVELRFES